MSNIRQAMAFPEVAKIRKGTPQKLGGRDGKTPVFGVDLKNKFRIDFLPGTASVEQDFSKIPGVKHVTYGPGYTKQTGWEMEEIQAVMPLGKVSQLWTWENSAHTSGIRLLTADDDHIISQRNPLNMREWLIRDGQPHTPFTPGDVLSYDRDGRHFTLPIVSHCHLRLWMPALQRLVAFSFSSTSYYDRITLDAQMQAIQFMADWLNNGNAGGIPYRLYRSEKEIPYIDKKDGIAKKTKKWLVDCEIDREWVAAATKRMQHFALTGAVKGLLEQVADTGHVPVEYVDVPESDFGDIDDGQQPDQVEIQPGPEYTENEYTELDIITVTEEQVRPVQPTPVQPVAPAKVAQPAQPTPAAPARATRPYPPETFKKGFESLRKSYANAEVSPVERNICAAALTKIMPDQTMRYETCKWLTGIASTKEMTPGAIKALLQIMGIASFTDAPSQESVKEFRSAHPVALVSGGQEKLLGAPQGMPD